jgi:hypothetical protein
MKQRQKNFTMLCITLALGIVFTACEEQSPALSSSATVSSVLIGGVQAQSLGTPNTNWMAVAPGDVYLSHSQLAGARISVNADSGAKVYYAKGAEGAQPYFAEDTVLSLEHDDIVWIEVFSANLDQYLIYAIKIHNRTPLLNGITVDYVYDLPIEQVFDYGSFQMVDREKYTVTHSFGLNLGTPGASVDDPALVPGEIWYGKTQTGSELTVTAQTEMIDSTVTISGSANFGAPVPVIAEDGSYFYIRSTSGQEQGETIYYKIKLVQKNDDMSLVGNKVVINGVDAIAGRMGAHSLVGQEAWGSYYDAAGVDLAGGYVSINTTADSVSNPVTVTVPLTDDTGVKVEYGHTSNNLDYLVEDENWSAVNNLGVISSNDYVVLRLTSELGVRGWYKFRVRIGRAGIGLSSITINNGTPDSIPASNAQVTGTTAVDYTMSAAGPWQTVSVDAVPDSNSGGAQIAYAIAPVADTNTPAASFVSTGSFNEVALAHYAVIRVVSENGENTGYYKFRLIFGDPDATLSAVTINGGALESIPEANLTADGAIAARYRMSADGPWSVTAAATATSNKAVVHYAFAPTVNAPIAESAWSNNGTLSDVSSGQYVFIRVTAEAGTVHYYKVQLSYGSSEATLTSVTVGGVSAAGVGLPGVFDPAMGGAYGGTPAQVTLTSAQAGDGSQVTVAAVASEGATVRYNWGGGMSFGGPPAYYVSEAPWNTTGEGLFVGGSFFFGFVTVPPGVNGALVFIEVTSQDGTTVNIYAVSCTVSD